MAQDLTEIAKQLVEKMTNIDTKILNCQDYKESAKLNKEKSDLQETFDCAASLLTTSKQMLEIVELLKTETDSDMRTMMNEEYNELEKKKNIIRTPIANITNT